MYMYRLKAVRTAEELSDVYAHFKLYYGRDLVEMQHRKAAQRREGEGEGEEDQVSISLSHIHVFVYNYNCSHWFSHIYEIKMKLSHGR